MRRLTTVLLVVFPIICSLTLAQGNPTGDKTAVMKNLTRTIDLLSGITDGTIKVKANGLGSTYGDAVSLAVTNLSKTEVLVVVPYGIVARSTNHQMSSMVLANLRGMPIKGGRINPTDGIRVAPGKTNQYIFNSYSTEYGKANPTADTALEPRSYDPVLGILLNETEKSLTINEIVQAAVWAYSGEATNNMLAEKLNLERMDVIEAREQLRSAIETHYSRSGNQ